MSKLLRMQSRISSDRGATAVEYGLIIGLIAVVIIVAVTLLGGIIQDTFNKVSCNLRGGTWTAATVTAGSVTTPGSCSK